MRIYGKWAGREQGIKEDTTRCIVEVAEGERSVLFHQCFRMRGYGKDNLFCKQHAKKYPDGKSIYIPKEV